MRRARCGQRHFADDCSEGLGPNKEGGDRGEWAGVEGVVVGCEVGVDERGSGLVGQLDLVCSGLVDNGCGGCFCLWNARVSCDA